MGLKGGVASQRDGRSSIFGFPFALRPREWFATVIDRRYSFSEFVFQAQQQAVADDVARAVAVTEATPVTLPDLAPAPDVNAQDVADLRATMTSPANISGESSLWLVSLWEADNKTA